MTNKMTDIIYDEDIYKEIITIDNIVKNIIHLFEISVIDKDKKYAAHLIKNTKYKYISRYYDYINIKEINKYSELYNKEKEKIKLLNQYRRHEKRKDFSLTKEEWDNAIEYFDFKCAYCGKEKKLTYDHFIPFSKNGEFTKENIIPCCTNCNSSKRDKEFEEWYKKQKYYNLNRYNKVKQYLKDMEVIK